MAKRNPERLEVTKIRYSRDVIDEKFDNGKKMSDVLSDLRTGLLDLDTLPKITVVRKGKLFFTLDNRRLWMFKQYAKFLQENRSEILQVPVKFESLARLGPSWLTTTSEGEFIEVQHNGSAKAHVNILTVKLSDIRYSSDCITEKNMEKKFDARFGNIHETAKLPVLKVVKKQDILYALDNEQLWMLKQWYESNYMGPEGIQSMSHSSKNDDMNPDEGATGNSDLQEDNYVDVCEDFTIKVELRPYKDLPEHFSTLDGGTNIEFRNRQTKHRVLKYKALTRQEARQDKKDLIKYCRSYEKQPKGTFKFFRKLKKPNPDN
ncbi:uncharacterized protein LOC132743390 [Ruditapes philippinarum]|uniref:uncharacterized protein LOC132743390 n=1 Tax=Ruditapes philippinarum TaxID=129788 RepID=UPI00295B37A0|nr:uncharacterized protein LOC132743390 [Ruditapes philippinarum]